MAYVLWCNEGVGMDHSGRKYRDNLDYFVPELINNRAEPPNMQEGAIGSITCWGMVRNKFRDSSRN